MLKKKPDIDIQLTSVKSIWSFQNWFRPNSQLQEAQISK